MSSKGVDVHVQVQLFKSMGIIREFRIFFENIPGCYTVEIPHDVRGMSVDYWCEDEPDYPGKYAGYETFQ